MKKVQLLRDEVLVRLRPRVTRIGSIYLDESKKERNLWADVIAVGPGRELPNGVRVPMQCRPGDLVRLQALKRQPIEDDGDAGSTWVVPEWSHVIGVWDGEEAPAEAGRKVAA